MESYIEENGIMYLIETEVVRDFYTNEPSTILKKKIELKLDRAGIIAAFEGSITKLDDQKTVIQAQIATLQA